MFDVEAIRKDFPMLQGKTMQGKSLIYLDNSATTFKPRQVIDAVVDYYENYSANAHRGDYDLSYFVDQRYEGAREHIANFLNAQPNEIIYTSGASAGLNLVAYGYGSTYLQEGDIILTSEAEHASCILPWMRVAKETKALIDYIPLENGRITLENVKRMMNPHVKVIVLAHITNVLGYEVPVKEICELAHAFGAIVVVDGAQSVAHMPIDVKDLDCDFFAFSGHKMCGPTGIGVLYGKAQLLVDMQPAMLGGDSNARYDLCGNIQLKDAPYKFESGTQPIEAVFGLDAAIQYLDTIGMENIHAYEKELHAYAIEGLKELDNIILYNADNDSGIITFNVKDVFAQDAASFFNANGIAVRSGQHCAKLLTNTLETNATLRASIYFYTTKEEIDEFLEVCAQANMENCLNIYF